MPARMHPLLLVAGFVVWAIWFLLMYSILSIVCKVAPPVSHSFNWLNGILLAMTIITSAVLFYFAYRYWSILQLSSMSNGETNRFIRWLVIALFIGAAIATCSIGMMVLFLPPCL